MNNEEFIDINSIMNKEDDFSPVNEIVKINPVEENKMEEELNKPEEKVIGIDRLFEVEDDKFDKEKKLKELKTDKLIERIQIGLILFLIVAGTLIYFFGYELFEPFIKID